MVAWAAVLSFRFAASILWMPSGVRVVYSDSGFADMHLPLAERICFASLWM